MLRDLAINTLIWAIIAALFAVPFVLGFTIHPSWWLVYAPLAAGSMMMQLGTEITISSTVPQQVQTQAQGEEGNA